MFELIQKPLSTIPIRRISTDKQKPFINVVDKILSVTQSEDYQENPAKQAKVKEYETQIDRLVYELYDLKEVERIIAEKATV
jgi:adenine-specific DNA-methyltransferase